MKNRLLAILVLLALLMTALVPTFGLAEDVYYVSTSNHKGLNIREGPGTNYAKIGSIPYRAEVYVTEYLLGSNWAAVTYDGISGYVSMRYLSTTKPNPSPTPTPTENSKNLYSGFQPLYYVAEVRPSTPTSFVNMRWAPTKSAPVQHKYYSGSQLQVYYSNGTWAQVVDPVNHWTGYMMTAFLTYLEPINFAGDGASIN